MERSGQTRFWSNTWSKGSRQRDRDWTWGALLKLSSPLLVTHLQQGHSSPSQRVPLTGDQVFKHMHLWRPFSFKPLWLSHRKDVISNSQFWFSMPALKSHLWPQWCTAFFIFENLYLLFDNFVHIYNVSWHYVPLNLPFDSLWIPPQHISLCSPFPLPAPFLL